MTGFFAIKDACITILRTFANLFQVEVFLIHHDCRIVAHESCHSCTQENPLELCSSVKATIQEQKEPFFYNPLLYPACPHCPDEGRCFSQEAFFYPMVIEEKTMGYLMIPRGNFGLWEKQDELVQLMTFMGEILTGKLIEERGSQTLASVLDQLSLVVNSIDEGIIAIDEQGVITHFNQAATQLTGFKISAVMGMNINKVFPQGELLEVLASGKGFRHREIHYQGAGRSHRLLITANPALKGARMVGVVASLRSLQEIHGLLGGLSLEEGDHALDTIIGDSPQIQSAKEQVLRIAGSNSSVLIQGESGTGKELFARAIHQASQRRKENFVSINCAAIPGELLESELFGYEGGAFTGAHKGGKPGKFELAHRGTIFFDEVGDMALELQVKILRVLQDRTFFRIGGLKEIDVDVRILSATNQDLETMIQRGDFREDLFYRLNVIPLEIPSLRQRRQDIGLLVEHFIEKYNARLYKKIRGVTHGARQHLEGYDWPGNVRELENVIEYAINMEPTAYITEENLPARMVQISPRTAAPRGTLRDVMGDYERRVLQDCLDYYGWDTEGKLKAARALGIGKTTLYNKLQRFHMGG